MNRLPVTIFFILFALLNIACNQQEAEEKIPVGKEGYPTPHFFTGIIKPKELTVVRRYGGDPYLERSKYTPIYLGLVGNVYFFFEIDSYPMFKKLATAIGDTASKKKYTHATPYDTQTTESGISGMSVKALSQFDKEHPQGSSLMDIIRIKYISFDHIFNKKLEPHARSFQHEITHTIEPPEAMRPITHPGFLHETLDSTDCFNGVVMRIEFLKPPTTSKQQIEVTMRFANGKELKTTEEVEIVKLD